jgi:hypothetical protein
LTRPEDTGSNLLYRRIGTELLIHDRRAHRVWFLNGTARQVWELLDAGRTPAEIKDSVCAAYPAADPVNVREDVDRCLAELREMGFEAQALGDPKEARGRGN